MQTLSALSTCHSQRLPRGVSGFECLVLCGPFADQLTLIDLSGSSRAPDPPRHKLCSSHLQGPPDTPTVHLTSGQHPESPRCLAVSPLSVTRLARCSSFVPLYLVGPLATLPIGTWLLPCLQCCLNSLVAKPPPHAATLPHLTAAPASLTGPPLEKRLRAPRQRS